MSLTKWTTCAAQKNLYPVQTTKWENGRNKEREGKGRIRKASGYSDCTTSPYKLVAASQYTGVTRSRRMGHWLSWFFLSFFFSRTAWAWLQFVCNSVLLTEKAEFHDGRNYKEIRGLLACFPTLHALIFVAIKNAVIIFSVWPALMLVKLAPSVS